MLVRKVIVTFVLFCFTTIGYAQNDEEFYLLFKEDSTAICQHSMFRDGREKTEIDFIYRKISREGKVRFIICLRNFEAIDKGDIITAKELEKLPIKTIDDLMRKQEANWLNTHNNNLFKNIYIIEYKDDSYTKFKVKWIDVYE